MAHEEQRYDELFTLISFSVDQSKMSEERFKADLKARFNSLSPENQLTLIRHAYRRHNFAAGRKIRAMIAERERLQKQIDDLQNNMSNDQVIDTHFLVKGPGEDRTNGFAMVVMQRIQLEWEAAELEAKQLYVAESEEEDGEDAEAPILRPEKG